MATKAELEAELEKLRARNAQLEGDATHPPKDNGTTKTSEEIRRLLHEHGIDLSGAEVMGEEVVAEFTRLQKDYPITALLIAFSLGYVVGRARG